MTRRRHLVLLGILAVLAGATAALAYWTAAGSGAAAASTGTLGAPSDASASTTAGSSTVQLAWTGAALSTGQPATGYYATRIRNSDGTTAAACGTSPAAPTGSTGCADQNVPDGTYHYVVTAVYHTWTASSGSSNDVTVVGETTAPAIALAFPHDGATYDAAGWNGGCPTTGLCGTASDPSGVAAVELSVRQGSSGLYWGGSSFNQASETFVPASGTTSWALAFARPPDGSYAVHVRASDTPGNITPSGSYASATFTVDTAPPTGSITAPSAGTVGGTVTVTSDSTDAGSGVAAAQFQLAPHGGAFSNLGPADPTSPYQASWDTTTVANGQYDLRVTTTDKVGNSATSTVVTVTVDNSFQVSVSGPQAAGTAFGVTITARAAGVTNTAYSGTRSLSFSGPGTAPDGTHTPIYPSSATFTNGVGTATVTLFKAESAVLAAASGNLSGSTTVTVNAGTSKGLSFTSQSLTGAGASELCNAPSTSCTITGMPKNGGGTWTAKVGMVDTWGNPTTASSAVTVTLTRSPSPGKGALSVSSVTIASGAAASSSSFTYTSGNGAYIEDVTASGSGGGVTNNAVTSVTTV